MAWANPGWSHQQPWEFTDNSAGVNNEEDWAARARAWAAAKAAMDAQQAPSQFTQVGRSVEHHHVYQEHYPQAVQPQFSDIQQPSLSALGHQSVQLPPVSIPNMATNQVQDSTSHFPPDVSSSYTADGFMAYSLKDEQNVSSFSSQGSIPAGTHSYPQDLATNYTSISGDEVEAARTAAINQEIKRVLTEVLLKVTDDLFDEIAQEVLDEDDNSTQAKKYGVNDRGRIRSLSKVSPPPPAIPTPTVSARVLISGKTSSAGSGDESGRSNSSAPGGNVLGLANYASDDDDDAEQPRRQQSTHREGDLLEENGNREEQSSQFRAEKRNITVNAGVEISRMDAKADTGEDKDEHRAREQSKDIMVNKEGREDLMGKKRLFTENQLDSQNVRSPDKNQGFESKDGAVSVSDEHEKPKAASKANVSKSGSKGMERYQPSSKDAHNEIDVDKGRSYDPQDREIKRKGNEKNEIKKSATRVNAEHGEENNKKVDNKQQDLVQHRKNGEKEREREKGRERDRDKAKEKEKNRVGDRKRAKEKLRDREGRRGSDRTHDKESRKDLEKERKATDKTDDRRSDKERGEKNGKGKQRDTKDTRKSRKRSSSVSSRGRNSKVDSYDSYDSSSGAEGNENARRRRVESSRRSSSPSPIIRSRKRQVSRSRSPSRSSHARHSYRRHSPYLSHEGRRKQSRSGSPARRRRRS